MRQGQTDLGRVDDPVRWDCLQLHELVSSGTRAPMPMSPLRLHLKLIGGFELTCDDSRIPLPHSAQRLLALLALNERPMLRSYVAGMLWLDSSEARSGGCLRTALWRLRRQGHHLVELDGERLELAHDVAVDVRWLAAAARALSNGNAVPDSDWLDQLTAGGELLPGWYDDWVIMERERTRELWFQTLEAAAENLTAAGRYAAAVVTALPAVEAEPLRESASRVLIKAHLARGNAAEAVRHYALYAKALQRDLGIEPSSEMQTLMAGLRVLPNFPSARDDD